MLSTENPPSDLPCQLKNNSNTDDERASDNNQVDLLKSGLDDKNPLPNFSIRDYVFSTRGKDIKNNWPFSQENLQICQKYRVKDVLPPFQSLDSVRNPSLVKCAIENLSYSELSDDHSVGQKLTVDIENINSSRSEEDREFPSTTTSQSCSDLNSVLPSKSPYFEPEADQYLSGSPTEFGVPASDKIASNIQNPVKKCRLILKPDNIGDNRKSNQDQLAVNAFVTSETMASKVCPVCKTFSSSSNTTLNAHIDQCLSGESTVKLTANPKVIKHRIKPRKTRLMVDVHETALHGTLEDLDRRNGTNWASNLGFPAQDLDKNKAHSSVNDGNYFDENGAVRIDSSKGIKLRSLSKLSDLPSKSMTNHDCGPSKLVEIVKGSKFDSSKKKKNHVQKHKLLKHPLYGHRSCSPSPNHLLKCPPCGPKVSYPLSDHCPEPQVVNNGQQKQYLTEGYKEGDLTQPLSARDQMKSNDLGLLKQWAGSTRTGLKKKMNFEHQNQQPNKTIKYTREGGGPPKSRASSYENPLLPIESRKRKDILACNPHDGCMEQHHRRRKGPGLKKNLGRQHLDLKKPRLNYTSGSDDEEAVVPRSGICREDNLGGNAARRKRDSGKPLTNGTRVLKVRKKRRGFMNTGKDMSLEGSDTFSPESDIDGVGKKIDSFTCCSVPVDASCVLDEVEIHDEFVREPTTYNIIDRELAFIRFSKSLDSTFHEFSGPNVESVRQHYCSKASEGRHSPAELELGDEQEIMFCADKVGKSLVNSNTTHVVAEMDAKRNYYVDVDPIPIPGPPGSFLPSPGRMGSEDFHGNSSLTNARILSSEDDEQGVVVDSDSDSPISTPSQSTPNPVLRLMGKNLMVVNKDENLSPQTRHAHSNSSMVIEHPGLMFCVDDGLSTSSNNQNERHSSGHILFRGPSKFDNMPAQHFDFNASPANFRPQQQLLAHPSMVLHSSASFGASLKCLNEYASGYSLTPDQLGPNIRVGDSQRTTYDIEQVRTRPVPQLKHKEIVVIDEPPESETSLSIKTTSMASQCDSRHVMNPFYNSQTRGYPPLYTGRPVVQKGNIQLQVPPSKGISSSLGKWNCSLEGSSVLHPDSLAASLPPTLHLRSSVYFSPGFS